MINNKNFIINLTELGLFSGLYNSIWMNDLTLCDELDELAEELKQSYNKIIKLDFSINIKEYLEKIAEVYINCFEEEIPNSKWKLERVASPKEYNFDTDHILLKWINAPKNAEKIFNNYLKQINSGHNDDNPYYDFESNIIYDFRQGYEIVHEISTIHNWDNTIVTYNDKGEPLLETFEEKQ